MTQRIPLVISEGDPFTRGKHLGRCERTRVLSTIDAYLKLFKQLRKLDRKEVISKAELFIPKIMSYAPHLLEEMRGISEGAGCDFREIVAINARTELLSVSQGRPECTSIGISSAASADGHVRLAQNWDWYPTLAETAVLWMVHRDDGPDLLTLTEAGIVGKIGMNAMGLAMCINIMWSDNDHSAPTVPMHILLRRILEKAQSVKQAIELIKTTERSTSCHHLLGDSTGLLASVEAIPGGQSVTYAMKGTLTHTNHCLNSDLLLYDRGARYYPETLAREKRIAALANKALISENDIRCMLADHATSPDSICLHDRPALPMEIRGESIASIIFDLTMSTVDIADGPPCCIPYRHLPPLFPSK